jgi:hypothetical protein
MLNQPFGRINMKKTILLLFFVMLLIAVKQDFAASPQGILKAATEKVVLITDRSIYIAGEQVHFSAVLFSADNAEITPESQILYAELITPDGNKLSGSKYPVINSRVTGCIEIPGDAITGIYYIRAYTRLMRNSSPDSYCYRQIRIINPGREEVLAGNRNDNTKNLKVIQAGENGFSDKFSISVEKQAYSPEDSVRITIQANKLQPGTIKNLSLSVVPQSAAASLLLALAPAKPQSDGLDYYPENRGLSLTGKLTEGATKNPVKGKRINLSIIGEGRDFMAVRTDNNGRFFFVLPGYSGSRDLFLCAEKNPQSDIKIWVDNDFCSMQVNLPSPVFSLTDTERQTAQNMAVNMQINSHFHSDTMAEAEVETKEKAFYGEPSDILYLDQFVQLPTLEEYFNELPGMVKVRKRNGEKYFKVIGKQDLSFYDPLVLVDWVAVDEPAKILSVSPVNISRIEIINSAYIKGGQTYGGIISIISKKGDFAGIDLPSTGIFINYRFLSESRCGDASVIPTQKYPDTRNTILWNPGIDVQNETGRQFVFRAPETPGMYSIVLDGITAGGENFSLTHVFEVE